MLVDSGVKAARRVAAATSDGASSEVARWVESARAGDRAAFTQLYLRFTRMVHGIMLAHVSRADVDDLVQDVFITAMQRLPALREPAAFGGWVATIARHRAVDHLRRQPRVVPLSDQLPDRSTAANRIETMAALAAIRDLPDTYRETLTLRFIEGMTGPEIAACTGLTEGSVRVNLHRGVKLLRQRLERK